MRAKLEAMRSWVLLLMTAMLSAEDAPLFFREPDRAARQGIREALAKVRSATRANRQAGRDELERIGPWVTDTLAEVLGARAGKEVARLNAAIVITRLRDAHGLPAIRGGLDADNLVVARACCLALGYFGVVADGERLERELDDRRFAAKPAAALACARIAGTKWAGETLVDDQRPAKREKLAESLLARTRKLPADEPEAAALLLAAVLAHPDADAAARLADRRELVAAAAAIGLSVRPAGRAATAELLALLERPGKSSDRWLRALRYAALGRADRTPAVRERLLEGARREEKQPQRAALLALADTPAASADELLAVLDRMRDSDPNRGALLFALARTGEKPALDRLLAVAGEPDPGPDRRAASVALLHSICTTVPDDAGRILGRLKEPAALISKVNAAWRAGPEELAALARTGFDDTGVGFELTRTGRTFALVNRFLPVLFRLDDLDDLGEASRRDAGEGAGIGIAPDDGGGGGSGGRGGGGAGRAPAEADQIDFLRGEPYFGPEHVRGR